MSSHDETVDTDDDDSTSMIAPGHLGNKDTMLKLAFIDYLKKLGINELVNLPQLVVIGDQSSGKSSVLQAITQLLFPVDDGLCTRFPTEVSLQRASEHSLEISIAKQVRAFDVLNQTLSNKKWLDKQSARIDDFNGKWEGQNAQPVDFGDIITQARVAIMGDPNESSKAIKAQNKKNVLSDATLKIVKKGPGEINITIIDIPGLVSSNHAGNKIAKSLVEHYINNPRSIVLAVAHPANVETQDIFQLIAKIDGWKDRVIGVITKCDKIEVDGDDWVYKAIKNEETDLIFNRCLKYGWFALRNLSPAERKAKLSSNDRDNKEAALFRQKAWTDLKCPQKLGIKNLKNALTTMHNEHVTRSIPQLIPEIEKRLEAAEAKIQGLGQPRTTPESQMNCLVNLATKYSLHAADAIDGHNDRLPVSCAEVKIRKIVRDALDEFRDRMTAVYEERFNFNRPAFSLESEEERTWERSILRNKYFTEISKCINDNRGMEMADEVNTAVLRSLWCGITPDWREQTQKLIEHLIKAIGKSVECLLHAICDEQSLRLNIQNLLEEDKKIIQSDAMRELEHLLNDEKSGLIVTLNKWNVRRLQELRCGRINFMVSQLDALKPRDKAFVRTQVQNWFGHHAKIEAIFTTHDKLASYYEIGMVRFVDNVCHQVCERHLLGGKSPLRTFAPDLITMRFQGNEEALKKIAGETKKQLADRNALRRDKELLRQAMGKAKEYKVNLGVQGMGL
ncbi:efc73118-0493-4721-8e7d-af57daba8c5e [Sclerotinia trifoliorum]|uniref:Efc73118-0493-4721-8e7d-af57daba8c5e n=1 Tax=Sclerotinia trifoliorum TaxID=28548 RepID=A0A8H2VUY3_9HELO|nr:efc73118-0493-4721-8e7d-af57daba8c5e [Sclerotinia trifoliorum]